MTDEETARLRAQVHEATRVLSGSYTIPQARQLALTEEYAETFAAAVERLLDERAALVEIARAVATADTLAYESDAGDDQRCVFCYGVKNEHGISDYQHVSDYHEWKHANDCPVTKARAILGD